MTIFSSKMIHHLHPLGKCGRPIDHPNLPMFLHRYNIYYNTSVISVTFCNSVITRKAWQTRRPSPPTPCWSRPWHPATHSSRFENGLLSITWIEHATKMEYTTTMVYATNFNFSKMEYASESGITSQTISTQLNGELTGYPMDIKLFEAIKWVSLTDMISSSYLCNKTRTFSFI